MPAAADSPAKLTVDEQGRVTSELAEAEDPVDVEVEIDFAKSEDSAQVNRLKSELLVSLWWARDLLEKQKVKVIATRPGVPSKKTFKSTKVVVTEEVAAYELVLVPVVKGLEAVQQKTKSTGAVPVEMTMHKNSTKVVAETEGESVPKAETEGQSVPKAETEGEKVTKEETVPLYLIPMAVQTDGKDRFMPAYWCVKQGASDEANMARDEVDVNAILSLLSGDEQRSSARTLRNRHATFSVPVMTNTKALEAGTELVFPGQKTPEKSYHKKSRWLATATTEFQSEFMKRE